MLTEKDTKECKKQLVLYNSVKVMAKPKDKLTVFHFARWYPHKFDAMYGLFIQRHAEAVALYSRVGVVYVHAALENLKVEHTEVDYRMEREVHTVRVYYPASQCSWGLLRSLINLIKFYSACFIGQNRLKKELGTPDVLHIHILSRLGLIGLYYRWFHGIPFVISEHWSRYLPTGNYGGILRKFFTSIVVRNSSGVTTVTENLAQAMQQGRGLVGAYYQVLPNVVDPVFFEANSLIKSDRTTKTFIHVSCFEDKSKNISGLLRVVSSLAKKRSDFNVVLVGEGQDLEKMKSYAIELEIPDQFLTFTGLLTGKQLVDRMNDADILVVTSHYENLPVVIIESFALGVPVISTRVGGIAEVVNNENGVLVNPGDDVELINRMEDYLDGKLNFDSEKIRSQSQDVYTFQAVGNRLIDLYYQALKEE